MSSPLGRVLADIVTIKLEKSLVTELTAYVNY